MPQILLVEDDFLFANTLKDLLEMEGITVWHAPDGEAALELYKDHRFDLVLSDVSLPKKDGFEVVSEIRRQNHEIQIVMMAGVELDEDSYLRGYLSGAVSYIQKPANIMVILAQVQALLKTRNHTGITNEPEIVFEIQDYFLKINGTAVKLTDREKIALSTLYENKEITLSRKELVRLIWNNDIKSNDKMLTQIMHLLNKKFVQHQIPARIVCTYGTGYALRFKKETDQEKPEEVS